MKLDKDTKFSVSVGDHLRFSEKESYTVVTVIDSGRSLCFTLRDDKSGQTIYAYPSSKLYGAEIVKQKTAKQEYIKRQAEVENLVLRLSHNLGVIEAFRQGDDNWADVATIGRLIEPLKELSAEVEQYRRTRVKED